MTETAVLIVDDDFREVSIFEEAFGDHAVTVCRSFAELKRIPSVTWGVAFVDFDLGEREPTGLSALKWLRERSESPIVSYTRMGESGRALYCAAAKSWFAANASLDKSLVTSENLHRYVRDLALRHDPTPPLLRAQLARADVINELLPDATSVRLWREYYDLDGDEAAIRRTLGLHVHNIRTFKEHAMDAVVAFEDTFFGRVMPLDKERKNRNPKGVITKFAGANRHFFQAVDLHEALSWRDRTNR
jgi:hypothetical protein